MAALLGEDTTPHPALKGIESIPDHRGQARAATAHFFAPPPPEIGTLISAECTLLQGARPMTLGMRLLIAVAIGGAIVAAFYGLASNVSFSEQSFVVGLGYVLGTVAALLTLIFTRFVAACTYVGEHGVARFTLQRSRQAPPRVDGLIFSQADELHAGQTRHFTNGIYTGTTYDYSWKTAAGQRLFRLAGRYRGKDKPPKAGDPFHFAVAAEIAWCQHYLARALEQFEAEGSIAFRVDRSRFVRVGAGFLEFHFGGEPQRVTKDDIASVSLGSGQFSFKHKDARWFSKAGKYNFSYGSMANGKVFLLALDKLMGYTWS